MPIDASIVLSLVALVVSLAALYLQWFRVKGAIVSLINDEKQEQRTMLLPSFSRLPEITRQQFPEYKEKHSGYAQVRLNIANVGDRIGISEILKIEAENPPACSTVDAIRASYYNYNLIPACDMRDQIVVLRNIPPIDSETTIGMTIKIAWGGANPRTGEYRRKGVIERTLKILLVPSEVKSLVSDS